MNILEKNLRLLEAKNQALYEKIISTESNGIDVLVSKANSYTARYNGYLINSMYNPMKEAEIRVDGIKDIEKSNLVFCIGFGLGYEVNEILRRINERCIVIAVITNLEIFKRVLESFDISNIFNYEKLLILDGTLENFKSYFTTINIDLLYFGKNISTFRHPIEENINPELIFGVQKSIMDSLLFNTIGIGNCPGDTLEGLDHIFKNFEQMITTCDLSELKGKFKDIPAICVASGPSLNKNIHDLKEAEGKAVIFAADTILEKLRSEGIRFHATSVLERPQFMYDKLFKESPLEREVVLFGSSVIYPKIFKEHNGKNVIINKSTTTAEQFLSKNMDNLNELSTGNSVAHMNFAIANYLGFNPIILMGQDLAYGSDGHSHAKGTIHESNTMEHDVKSGKVDEAIYVKGINGEMVKTTAIWKFFLDWFELEIRRDNIDCIDASEDGAYIEGTKVMTLKDAINTYCTNEVDIKFNEHFGYTNDKTRETRKNIISLELEKQLSKLNEVINVILKTKRQLSKFKKTVDLKKNEFNINEYVDPINKSIYELLGKSSLFTFIIQALTLELGRNNNGMVSISAEEDCIKWYNLQLDYINNLHGILKLTKQTFKNGIKNIQKL